MAHPRSIRSLVGAIALLSSFPHGARASDLPTLPGDPPPNLGTDAAAGNTAELIFGRGHTHTSLTMVDAIITSVEYRARMAAAIRSMFDALVTS